MLVVLSFAKKSSFYGYYFIAVRLVQLAEFDKTIDAMVQFINELF